ncbi:DNA-binding response regulator, NarL/FixJ family, contains REC and HTH domains [Gemmobacter aquatilis]|uniref:DNA-binding response regulator, NarL/FixJ family, contains REC and HTH domains n=1 Tax=Gemmobacter aquatilis TaxID=933059 RepID=A0A1H8DT30_9RHOB|nr:response regulator transcription factor [Gemmobacter aquatilis]SEN10014.1 DNA-binding response regulator, NarL/FixJ family, contains REC and HTH domains [Gemmobacter aquatilis]
MTSPPPQAQPQPVTAPVRDCAALRALILDDNRETRNWIAETLGSALAGAQIDTATTCAEARALLADPARHYDFALIDLDLPDGNGVDIIRALVQNRPDTLPVVITIFEDDASLFEALAAGAMGYILKGVKTANLIEQFRRIEQGEPPISPRIAQRILAHFKTQPPRQPPLAEPCLTQRELEVLRLLGKGLTVADIAQNLGISANTCATHTKSIYRKLNISTRAEAALAADRRGLI